jgi:hypothetical protein
VSEQAHKAGEPQQVVGHRLNFHGPAGNFAASRWWCECGKWESGAPARGPYGNTSARARIAQVEMAHGKHSRAAIASATRSQE